MLVGFAQTDITPPVGAVIPGDFRRRISTGVHDPLHATACVIDDGQSVFAIVSVDALSVKSSVVENARTLVQSLCGIPKQNILIAATHTHCGGPIANVFECDADEGYCQFVAEKIAEATAKAFAKAFDGRVECQTAITVGHENRIAFNRRFVMKNGRHQTHPGKGNPDIVRPAGPIDPDVGVLAFKDKSGMMLGFIVNFACHCTVMGGTEFSADYPFYLSQTIRKQFGDRCLTVFLQGASGDVTQVANTLMREPEFGEKWAWRIGTRLGGEVIKAVALAEFFDDATLQSAQSVIKLARRQVPEKMLEMAKQTLSDESAPQVERIYAREILLLAEEVKTQPLVDAEVQVLAIGECAIVSIPGELFCQLGLDIKRASNFAFTFIATCANGMVGYLPTVEAFKGGGYEVRLARSSQLVPDAGNQLVGTALQMLQSLKAPQPKPSKSFKTPAWDVGASPPELTGLTE
ncbi:MAG: neutral/alkaline non-lysosomal ceramidase N-terminal domain-containing protein [Armatimonadetes bacterium]|nr:neutral/alkaline non-lysosomal ceramidase N-terminal domain-containing protein [Armatimonadota bacterium]MDW8028856.1 neutral/alkaline non-lysosomal ceramidase N-terminal domain-containing protein [Armatimonadota bacterium]